MRSLFCTAALFVLASPAFANPVPVPSPDTLSLLGIGVAAAIYIGRRNSKKL